MDQEKLGKFLLTLRKEKNLKQKDVAKQICVTAQAVSKWERGLGIPDISLWNSICEIYDITLVELLKGEREEKIEKEKDEKINNLLKDTLDCSNNKISKMELKVALLLIGLAISIYIVSLALNSMILNYALFIFSSIIVIYSLVILLKKWNYPKRFFAIVLIFMLIVTGYSYLEKIGISTNYRAPILAIKEIYKEYKVTVYNSFFYKAYNCDDITENISLLNNKDVEQACAPDISLPTDDTIIVLKSGATISQKQRMVLEEFSEELLKHGYVDYNYMREQDLQSFWSYIDEKHYCNNYETTNSSLLIKRKDGVCQYNNDAFYYCVVTQKDGSTEYKKATNRSCD